MCASPALLVVLLLSVGRPAHQLSVLGDDDYNLPRNSDDSSQSFDDAMNANKRDVVGKFLRIGRPSHVSDDTLWPSRYFTPFIPRLIGDVLTSRRQRSLLFTSGVRRRHTADKPGLRLSVSLRDAESDSSAVDETTDNARKNNRSTGVRFVRIGKSFEPAMANNQRVDNIYRRSLENRFVRIGK